MLDKIQEESAVHNMLHAMGRTKLDFYVFYILKRVDKAYQTCSENLVIPKVFFFN